MADVKTTDEATRSPVDGSEFVRLATATQNWKATVDAIRGNSGGGSATSIASIAPIVGDGVSDNTAAFQTFRSYAKTQGLTFPVTVTISIGANATITWSSHGLRVNEAVVFSTTGALPTGIVAGTTYYVIPTGLTLNAFQISTHNPFPAFDGVGAAVTTSGSQSGTHSIQVRATDWQDYLLPPGNYFVSGFAQWLGNQRRTRLFAYGAASNNLNASTQGLSKSYDFSQEFTYFAYTQEVFANSTTITLIDATKASMFDIGGWLCIMGLDMMNTFGTLQSFPPNNHYFEFVQIRGISAGVITTSTPLKNSYKQTFPTFFGKLQAFSSSASAGAAMVAPMCSDWDMEAEVHGLHHVAGIAGSQALTDQIRSVRWVDCVFENDGSDPTVNRRWIAENCVWTSHSQQIEIDKLVEDCQFIGCTVQGTILVQSSSIQRLLIDDCEVGTVLGTPRSCDIRNSFVGTLQIGPIGFGQTESLMIEDSTILAVQAAASHIQDSGNSPLSGFTFSLGVLSQPMISGGQSTLANNWAVPGAKYFVTDVAGSFQSMGAPFTILDVSQTATSSSTVTISIASPAVISWTAHGLIAGTVVTFNTTGALPTGLDIATPYYVLAAGLVANSFEVSTSVGGSPVVTTGSQSGVHTAFNNPQFSIATTLAAKPAAGATALRLERVCCPRITVKNSTGCLLIGDMQGIDNVPLWSYANRTIYNGYDDTPVFVAPFAIMGNLVSLRVEVIKPGTGAGAFTLTLTAVAFDTSNVAAIVAGNMTQTIDMKTAGVRTITPAGVTGSVGADSISAFGNWIESRMKVAFSTPGSAGNFNTLVKITIATDQTGGVGTQMMFIGDGGHMELKVDTGARSPLGSFGLI